jgi:predicted SprT family Zn-dependent metalloprotease
MRDTIQAIADTIWQDSIKLFPKLKKFTCPTIIINNRLKKTIAYNRSETNEIHLARVYLNKYYDRMVTEILCHELAHEIDWLLNGWAEGDKHHRKSWQNILVKMGYPANRLQENMSL